MTIVSDIVRGVMAEYGLRGYWFNDRMVSGDRSIKVLGLSTAGYAALTDRLQNAGYGVKPALGIVRHQRAGLPWRQKRLHVRLPRNTAN